MWWKYSKYNENLRHIHTMKQILELTYIWINAKCKSSGGEDDRTLDQENQILLQLPVRGELRVYFVDFED